MVKVSGIYTSLVVFILTIGVFKNDMVDEHIRKANKKIRMLV